MTAQARRFALGSYTPDGPAPSLHLAERSASGEWRVVASAVASNPSFVARSGDLLFAVLEESSGSVASFRVDGGPDGAGATLVPVAVVQHGEADPCHVVVDAASGVLLVANYSGGSVTAVPFDSSGGLGRPVTLPLPPRTGPVADRQDAPHAHQVVPTPWGTHLVSDLGGDAIHELVVERATDAAGPTLRIARTIDLAPGTGPRHLLVQAGVLHVIGELDGRLHTFELDAATARAAGTEAAVVAPPSGGRDDIVQPSHLDASPSGRLLTALVRGRDTVSVFEAVDPAAPHLAGEHAIGAAWPRHHAHLDDRTLVVAAERGGALVEVDLVTGAARRVLELTAPACVLPLD
ncbi:lactonase family protein [Agromyces aurantiacus]|uniref:Lactonase family protein n=1 Tax=Agromyces aurantiacus TaxID=165814 RepID=A0ABV9R2V4_9MICO|nr:beta-propeller fold lactonase family protein [Agromyces aurantiacus]MBM7503136.1 6-phosphogluconolactonase (cycloisomerase 2 family) [Agromyces aurantiacus]